MRGLVFDLPLGEAVMQKYPFLLRSSMSIAQKIGKLDPLLMHRVPITPLKLRDDVPEPNIKDFGSGWKLVRPILCGICGSDIGLVHQKLDPVLPFSYPCVIGHEVVVKHEGKRYAVNPLLSCDARGLNRCESCSSHMPEYCRNFSSGKLPQGMFTGYTRGVPGGMADFMAVHESQMFEIPDTLSSGEKFSDRLAVLVEPMAVAAHAVLNNRVSSSATVFVIGGGMIAFATTAILRIIGHTGRIVQSVMMPHQRKMARKMGADDMVLADFNYKEMAFYVGGRKSPEFLTGFAGSIPFGCADVTFDCIASTSSINRAMELTREGGSVVLVGMGVNTSISLTQLIARGKSLMGSYGIGYSKLYGSQAQSTMKTTIDLMRRTSIPLEDLVTHVYSLEEWKDAFDENITRRDRSIKTVLQIWSGKNTHGRDL